MIPPQYSEKFIAFVDLLGFKQMVVDSERGGGPTLSQILALLKEGFGTQDLHMRHEVPGPFICPGSLRIDNNIDFCLSQISDCAVVSTEVSPAGAINMIGFCWGVVIKLLRRGVLCRGHITRGKIYHTPHQFIGTGYQDAVEAEKKVSLFQRDLNDTGTPFIEVGNDVFKYIKDINDACVSQMFDRMTQSVDDAYAIFPFKRFEHDPFGKPTAQLQPDKEHEANNNIRKLIEGMKKQVISFSTPSSVKAKRKIDHYVTALDAQLKRCDETDEFIDRLMRPAVAQRHQPL